MLLLVAACGGGARKPSGDEVAVVGDKAITKQQFDGLMNQARRTYQAQRPPRKFPAAGTTEFNTLKNQAVQFLVQRAEFEQEADDLDVKVDDKKVDKRLKQVKEQLFGGSEKRYREELKRRGYTDRQIRDDIKAQIISEELFKKVTADVKVSDDKIKKTFKEQYEGRTVRHILVPSRAQADKLYKQIKGGADFGKLARKFSKDTVSARQGGKLTVTRGQLVPEFAKVAFALKTNEISKPVKTQYGYHIIQALGPVHPTTSYKKVKATIRQQLEQKAKNDKMTKWVEDTRKQYCPVKYAEGYNPPAALDPCSKKKTETAATR